MGFSTPSTGICLRSLPPHPRLRSSWRPLHRAASDVGTLLSLLCLRRGVWGHSSRRFAFGGVYGDTPLAALPSEGCMGTLLSPLCLRRGVPIIILGQCGSDCIPIVFSKAGKTILDPSMRTVH